MAGRITINAGDTPVILVSLNAAGAQLAFQDDALTVPALLPLTVQAKSAVTVYVNDGQSLVVTVKDWSSNHTLQAVTTSNVRAGSPLVLGPFFFSHATTVA